MQYASHLELVQYQVTSGKCEPVQEPVQQRVRRRAGIESGPVALCGLRLRRSFSTPEIRILMCGKGGYGLGPLFGIVFISSSVKTDLNWLLRIFALRVTVDETIFILSSPHHQPQDKVQ